MSSSRRLRAGFTLVEMLVVIAIIGILAALLIPAIFAAVTRARVASIVQDMTQIEMALDEYKNKYGDYPPNFFELYTTAHTAPNPDGAWAQTVLARHLKRIHRQAKATGAAAGGDPNHPLNVPDLKAGNGFLLKDPPNNAPIIADPSANITYIDPAEALVIWLGGLSSNSQYPLTGPGGPFFIDPNTGVYLHPSLRRETALFEFEEDRLEDYDQDGLYEYYPPAGSSVPYAYFDSRSYDNAWAEYSSTFAPGGARPYAEPTAGSGSGLGYAGARKFQILCAGLDERFGEYSLPAGNPNNPADRKLYPSGTPVPASNITAYDKEDLDNITNFSGGVLEDKLPN